MIHQLAKILILVLITARVGLLPTRAVACAQDSLSDMNHWTELRDHAPGAHSTLIQFNNWQNDKQATLDCLAKKIFSDFLIQRKKITYRSFIPDSLDQEMIIKSLSKEAIIQTLQFFEQSHSSLVSEFAKSIKSQAHNTGLGFTLTESSQAIEDRPAGYVRAQGHVIMNYDLMTRDDWLFLFTHEFSHFIDPFLRQNVNEAIKFYQDHPNFVVEMLGWTQGISSLSELSADKQTLIDQFLRLSLQRGWIPEISAWAKTMQVYNELKLNGNISGIKWADEMASKKSSEETWNNFFVGYLRSRFNYPNNAVYNNALLNSRSQQIEDRLIKLLPR